MNIPAVKKSNIAQNAIGEKFGKLTVESFAGFHRTPRSASVPMMNCLCDCGTRKVISLWDLRSGKTRSCGFNHPHYQDRTFPAFKNLFLHAYKGRALKAGIDFTLTEDDFRELTQKPCHYCGVLATNMTHRTNSGKYLSSYPYNGLDRKDNSQGYTLANVVPCCATCNHAKHTLTYDVFLEWIDRLVKFNR